MKGWLVVTGLGIVALVAELLNMQRWLRAIVITGLIAALGLVIWERSLAEEAVYSFSRMIIADTAGMDYSILIIGAAIFWFALLRRDDAETFSTEKTSLILFSTSGALVLTIFNSMPMLFLGIELLSIPLYVMAGSRRNNLSSTEAAFKYFLMGSFATGFLLFGITLIYGATGSFDLALIKETLAAKESLPAFFTVGLIMMTAGLAFKISAVPFHFWVPDVYEGSPATVTAFMATVVKIAAIAAFVRMFSFCLDPVYFRWLPVVQILTVLTLIIPNITAVYQSNVKRLLAYSSVGHIGFILLAVMTRNRETQGIILYYVTAYASASLITFHVLALMEKTGRVSLDGFAGFFKKSPLLAIAMSVALMSLAGIPPLAGFFGKYLVFINAVNEGFTGLVILAVAASLIGVYYYFRVIIAMFTGEDNEPVPDVAAGPKTLVVLLLLLLLALGIFPNLVNF